MRAFPYLAVGTNGTRRAKCAMIDLKTTNSIATKARLMLGPRQSEALFRASSFWMHDLRFGRARSQRERPLRGLNETSATLLIIPEMKRCVLPENRLPSSAAAAPDSLPRLSLHVHLSLKYMCIFLKDAYRPGRHNDCTAP